MRAVRDGAVCMVNPFRCKILYKKASLAVLSDERNAGLFTPTSARRSTTHIPWTRVVEERTTTLRRRRRSTWCRSSPTQRERLVLKPNDDYGGKGIVLAGRWTARRGRRRCRPRSREPYIVQERVALPSEPYPEPGRRPACTSSTAMLDTAPYVVLRRRTWTAA